MTIQTGSVTVLFPFDFGRTFAVPPGFKWSPALAASPDSSWRADSIFPPFLRAPLGPPLVRTLQTDDVLLQKGLRTLDWCGPDYQVEIVFFPVGVGFLVLRAPLTVDIADRVSAFSDWEGNLDHYGLFEAVARKEMPGFEEIVSRTALAELPQVARTEGRFIFPWIYALFFLPDASAVDDEEGSYVRDAGESTSGVHVAWTYADIVSEESLPRIGTEGTFISAGVAWQTLFITDTLLSAFLEELNYQQVSGRRSRRLRLSQMRSVRAFCARVTDAARPLCWTVHSDALSILEQLGVAWTIQNLLESTQSKTELVAMLYQQIEDEENERRNQLFSFFAITIAMVSLVSAVADLIALFDPEKKVLPTPVGGMVAVAVPVLCAVLVSSILRLGRR